LNKLASFMEKLTAVQMWACEIWNWVIMYVEL
jgi:hypothetical protein